MGAAERKLAARDALGLLALIAILVAYKPFYGIVPLVFDEWLALPIARATATPGLYPPGDLLVTAGQSGPFWLYKLAAWAYRLGWNIELTWGAAFAACQALLFVGVWRLLRALTLSRAAAVVALVLLAASPSYRGTLNWTQFPFFAFVTASVAVPLVLLAVADALADAPWRATLFTALAFNVHPGAGVVAGCAVGVLFIVRVPRERWRQLAGPVALGIVVAMPNVIAILRHAPTGGGGEAFLSTFRDFATHVYPGAHWRENYAFFAVLLVAGWWGTGALAPGVRRGVRALVIALMSLIALYAVNAATTEFVPVLLLYLYRTTWILKPVLAGCACAGLMAWIASSDPPSRMVKLVFAGVIAAATVVRYDVMADGLAAMGFAGVLLTGARRPVVQGIGLILGSAGLLLTALALGVPLSTDVRTAAGALQLAIIGAATLALATMPPPVTPASPNGDRILRPALLALAFVVFAPLVLPRSPGVPRPPWAPALVAERFRFLRPPRDVGGLYAWVVASTPPGAFFVTPPNDGRFLPFRALAGRGQYAIVPDINQLAYDPPAYRQAAHRLQRLGIQVVSPGVFDGRAYAQLSDDAFRAIAAEGVTHAIVPLAAVAGPRPFPELYRDEMWAVLDLRSEAARTP